MSTTSGGVSRGGGKTSSSASRLDSLGRRFAGIRLGTVAEGLFLARPFGLEMSGRSSAGSSSTSGGLGESPFRIDVRGLRDLLGRGALSTSSSSFRFLFTPGSPGDAGGARRLRGVGSSSSTFCFLGFCFLGRLEDGCGMSWSSCG